MKRKRTLKQALERIQFVCIGYFLEVYDEASVKFER